MGLGERLRREREMRGITLDEIAKATKIGSRSLRALEDEDFGKLPGGIFNKGFVRAYARYLGLNEEDAVADYMAAAGELGDPALDPQRLKRLEATWNPSVRSNDAAPLRLPWTTIIILLVLLGLIFAIWHYRGRGLERLRQWRERRHTPQSMVAPKTSSTPAAATPVSAPAPVAASGSTTLAAAQLPSGAPDSTKSASSSPAPSASTAAAEPRPSASPEFTLLVKARQRSWVSAVADGRKVLRGTLKAGQEESIQAREKILLTAGNAGGLEVQFNSGPSTVLGVTNEVRTVTFTAQGLQPQMAAPE